MKPRIIQIPDHIFEKEAKMILAAKLYELGKITQGEGAKIAGIRKREFIEILGTYSVSIFNDLEEPMLLELYRRNKEIENGTAKKYTWEEVQARAKENLKQVKFNGK